MWLAVIALCAGCAVGLALGGSVGFRWSRLRHLELLAAGEACQLVAGRWLEGVASRSLVIAAFLLILAFAALNFRLVGMVLVAAGVAANLIVIGLDAGMPVRGLPPQVTVGYHHGARTSDHLLALADDTRIPALGETVSAGDVVLAFGVAIVAAGLVAGSRRRRRPSVRAQWPNGLPIESPPLPPPAGGREPLVPAGRPGRGIG